MTKQKNFKTIFPALAVPFNDDNTINEPEYRQYCQWIASFDGIGGVVVNGHTGEITALTRAERKRVVQITSEEIGDRLTIISGINSESTQGAIDMARDAKEVGADGILLMPPHMWLRFGMNPNAPFEYVKDVAEGADIDIIIHLYPATTKAFYPIETLQKMCTDIPHVKGVKMGTRVEPIYEHDIRELRKNSPETALLTCHDETLLSSMFPGMDGAIIGFAAVIPELITKAWKVYETGTMKDIRKMDDLIYPMSQAIYGGGQPSGEAHARLKEALVQRGIFTSALMRKPVLPLDQTQKDWIAKGLKESQVGHVDLAVKN